MRKKISLGIALGLFIFLLGINSVKAETCTFWRDTSRTVKEYYVLELNSSGLTKATHLKVSQSTNKVLEEQDKTSSVTIDFTSCSAKDSYTFDGHPYHNVTSIYVDGDWRKGSKNSSNSSSNPSQSNGTGTGNSTTPEWLKGEKISCGNIGQIPAKAPELVHMFILIAQIAVPIILVILGMIDFAKGIMSQKEDEIKKGQKTFISRLVMGAVIFFIVALVKLLIGIVVDNSGNRQNIIACIDCFVNNDCH